ncbi:MAG: hypothetical protein ACOCVM_09350, partial [Desulfovibrionaceae bacterium]
MSTNVAIANNALLELGADRITSMDQDTETARIVKHVFDQERDGLLEEHPWNFALARAELPLLGAAPEYGFERAFQLPSDCLRVLDLEEAATDYRVEAGRLLCDLGQVKVRYIRKITSPRDMPPTFRAALSARIAAKIAVKLTASGVAGKERMEKLYERR